MAYATCSKESGCQTRFEFSPTLSFELYHDVPKRLTWHNNWPNLWIPVECFTNLTNHGQEKREPHMLPRIFLNAFATKAQALDCRKACWASFGIESNWVIRKGLYGCFLKWWYPQKHPKMIIFSRKTHGPVGETHHFRKPPYIDDTHWNPRWDINLTGPLHSMYHQHWPRNPVASRCTWMVARFIGIATKKEFPSIVDRHKKFARRCDRGRDIELLKRGIIAGHFLDSDPKKSVHLVLDFDFLSPS